MSLESGTYISDLNTSNPTAGDPKSQGDDHIRLIKTVIKNTFPNITGPVTGTQAQLNAGKLIGVQVFTSTGTYTPTTGTSFVVVECQGGGGGSGGCVATTAGQWSAGRPGAGGGWGRKKITSSFSGVTVTVGAGGVAGAAGDNGGGTGGTSSFDSVLQSAGGSGGGGSGAALASAGFASGVGAVPATGGVATGADVAVTGAPAGVPFALSASLVMQAAGGDSFYGKGGSSRGVGSNNYGGLSGTGYGSGAAGPVNSNGNLVALAGTAGQPGLVVVWEYA